MRTQPLTGLTSKLVLLCSVCLWAAESSLAQVNVSVGTLQPGQSVTIAYEVIIDTSLPDAVTHISSQGTVSEDTPGSVLTDDPETTASSDPTLTRIGNHSPGANLDTLLRGANEDVKVEVSTLLSNDTDAESDTISFLSVLSPSTGGATVALNGNWVYYSHNGTSADSFHYTISDGHGGTSQGTVQVQIKATDAQARSTLGITVDGTGAHLWADGIPGRTYTIQFKDNVNDAWQTLGTALTTQAGVYTYNDPAGTLIRMYRSVFF